MGICSQQHRVVTGLFSQSKFNKNPYMCNSPRRKFSKFPGNSGKRLFINSICVSNLIVFGYIILLTMALHIYIILN